MEKKIKQLEQEVELLKSQVGMITSCALYWMEKFKFYNELDDEVKEWAKTLTKTLTFRPGFSFLFF